jgi:hypothetical protein
LMRSFAGFRRSKMRSTPSASPIATWFGSRVFQSTHRRLAG